MPTIIEPDKYADEETLRIPIAGSDRCYVVSGYADFSQSNAGTDGHPVGSQLDGLGDGSSDHRWISHTIHLIVGPKVNEVIDVSPIVNVTGISFIGSDETDSTGYEILSCKWDAISLPEPEQGLKRIRLKVELRMCGGEQSTVTMLSYHLTTLVKVFSIVG